MNLKDSLHSLARADNWQGLLNALSVSPRGADSELVRRIRAECHFRLYLQKLRTDPQAAVVHCHRALALAPGQWIYHFHAALCALGSGNDVEAKTCFSECSRLAPQNGRVHLHLAAAFFCSGEVDKACEAAQKAVSLGPKTLRKKASLIQAISLAERGAWDEAGALFERPGSGKLEVGFVVLRSFNELRLGHTRKAVRTLDSLRKKKPNDPLVSMADGLVKFASGKALDAAQCFAKLKQEDLLTRLRFVSSVHHHLQRAPDTLQALKELQKRGQAAWARELLRAMQMRVHWERGVAFFDKEKPSSSVLEFRTALRFSAQKYVSRLAHNLALAGEMSDQPTLAAEGWRQALNQWKLTARQETYFRSPRVLGQAHLRLAQLYLEFGEIQHSHREIGRARKLLGHPCRAVDRDEAFVLYLLGRRRQAWQLVKSYAHRGASPHELCLFGLIAMGSGYSTKARELWNLALSNPHYALEVKCQILEHARFEYMRRLSEEDYKGASKVWEGLGHVVGEELRDEFLPPPPRLDVSLAGLLQDDWLDELPSFLIEQVRQALHELNVFVGYYLPMDDLRLAPNAVQALEDVDPLHPLAIAVLAYLMESLTLEQVDSGVALAELALQCIENVEDAKMVLRFMIVMTPFLPTMKSLESLLARFPHLVEGHLFRYVRARSHAEARTELAIAEYLSKDDTDRLMIDFIRRLVEYTP